MYIILGGFVVFALFLTLFIMAGQDIKFALMRRFRPKGADIFIHNPNRHIDRYYKIADDEGNFKIKGKTYITNPEKVGALGDVMKEKIELSEEKRKRKIHENIKRLVQKREGVVYRLKAIQEQDKPNNVAIAKLNEIMCNLDDRISFFKTKLNLKEQTYFMQRRSVYHYIENDPVPKDMYEQLTEFDIIQLENVIARAQSKDPEATKNLEQTLKTLKLFIIIAGAIALIGAYFSIKAGLGVEDIARNLGVTLKV